MSKEIVVYSGSWEAAGAITFCGSVHPNNGEGQDLQLQGLREEYEAGPQPSRDTQSVVVQLQGCRRHTFHPGYPYTQKK